MSKATLIFFLVAFLINGIFSQNQLPEVSEEVKRDILAIVKNETIAQSNNNSQVEPKDVNYYLYLRELPNTAIRMDRDQPLVNDSNAKIALFIHGWLENRTARWYEDMKSNFFKLNDDKYNVIQVDWAVPAKQTYAQAITNTKEVGKMVGHFIEQLAKNSEISRERFLLIGFGLGAHAAGFAGKHIQEDSNQKLPRIVALDPAGPIYEEIFAEFPKDRLDKDDADVVTAVHTSGGAFGYLKPIGSMDVYLNGGQRQPGCDTYEAVDEANLDKLFCSHRLSTMYYADSVNNLGKYITKKCGSYVEYLYDKCSSITMPLGDLNGNYTGKFYFDTVRPKQRPQQ